MELYHTTDADGISELNPSIDKMRELLDSLDARDADEAEHPDVSLIHDHSGWSLSVYPSGVVTFENLDEVDDAPRFMSGITRNQALEMWLELSRGKIQQVNSRPWLRDEA
ncbi:hypothetical protein SH580_15470 [Coraliomargarita algicola]|uniref:Uncharacterized protein n=2 Tax=Coraliomargaritaceae TaxID=3056371 RepID=A0ABU1AP56_9BACT|nr:MULTISPECIES: hypothetical protein [unclassified Coraliomargarita]MDQ8205881.1 hypothetical protein [Coraliomargarita sp. SDUM461003]WPJ94831.1 hypothetical protein SH580_15470 [Coraliomargarita sp. J2-16]